MTDGEIKEEIELINWACDNLTGLMAEAKSPTEAKQFQQRIEELLYQRTVYEQGLAERGQF